MRFGWPGGRNHWLLGREVLSAWWGTWQLLSRLGRIVVQTRQLAMVPAQ
ncbi:hypothetical protein [Mycobacterium tuberculosis]|nr:hypothetical protein [Mycobacterium tuberculosis]SIP64993.1 hypothetical protein BN9982_1540015 [Mycobacterium tuberculosis]